MHTKYKIVIAGIVVCVTLLVVCWSLEPKTEVHGNLSKQDVAELVRLGRVERHQDLIDWSAPPPPWNVHQFAYRWRRFRFESAGIVRIDQISDHSAEVVIGTESSTRNYHFEKTMQGWESMRPEFE